MQRAEIIAKGDVQKVWYRAKVLEIAANLNIKGEIENLENENVKIIAEGEKEKLEEFIEKIKVKDELINVKDLSVNWSEPTNEFTDFRKIVKSGETDERLDTASVHLKELIRVTKYGIEENKKGFADLSEKQGQMLEKQDQTIEVLGNKIDSGNKMIVDKLDTFHQDTTKRFDTVDIKYGKIAGDMEKILQEMKEERIETRNMMKDLVGAILKVADKE